MSSININSFSSFLFFSLFLSLFTFVRLIAKCCQWLIIRSISMLHFYFSSLWCSCDHGILNLFRIAFNWPLSTKQMGYNVQISLSFECSNKHYVVFTLLISGSMNVSASVCARTLPSAHLNSRIDKHIATLWEMWKENRNKNNEKKERKKYV